MGRYAVCPLALCQFRTHLLLMRQSLNLTPCPLSLKERGIGADITPSYGDPPIPYALSPLTKGGKGWVKGDFAQADSVFCE